MRFTVVDALRGIAALSVVLHHSVDGGHISSLLVVLPPAVSSILRSGYLGVAVFFVLSGFVIAHSLSDLHMTMGNLGRFALRRSLRLDPPYWAAIALTMGFGLLATVMVSDRAPSTYSSGQVLAHVFYMQDILGYPPISLVFWTLCFEVQFYFVYAALLVFGRYEPEHKLRNRSVALLLGCGAVVSLLWPLGLGPTVPNGTFPPLWHGFLLGAGSYWAWKDRRVLPPFLAYAAILLVGGLWRGDPFTVTCGLTAILLLASGLSAWIYRGLDWRPLQFLGLVSYSLYLTHNPVTGAAFRIGYKITGRTAVTEAFWFLVVLLTCIGFAGAMWWLVERPSIAWSRRVRLKTDRLVDQRVSANKAVAPIG